MNVLTLLKQDHRNVDELFTRAEKTDDPTELAHVRDLIVEHLSVHAAIEEQVFYPALREASPELEATVLEGLEEHHAVKVLLAELQKLAPTAERFRPKLTVVVEQVRHHVDEEETDLFPEVRKHLKAPALERLGDAAEKAKEVAPTRPHPLQPDQPPLNVLLGMPVAIFDKVVSTAKDTVTQLLRKAS